MKKLTVILFSAFYLLATVGIAFNVHYCGNEIGNIALFANEGSCCCGEEKAMDDCCDDEQFFFQFDQEQKLVQSINVPSDEFLSEMAALVVKDVIPATTDVSTLYKELKIPIQHKLPSWLLHCSLTYYG